MKCLLSELNTYPHSAALPLSPAMDRTTKVGQQRAGAAVVLSGLPDNSRGRNMSAQDSGRQMARAKSTTTYNVELDGRSQTVTRDDKEQLDLISVYEAQIVGNYRNREHLSDEDLDKFLHRTKIWNVLVLLYGGGLMGFSFYTSTFPYGGQSWAVYMAAICGFVSVVIALLGCIAAKSQSERTLLAYFAVLVVDCLMLFFVGGFTIIMRTQVTQAKASIQLAPVTQEDEFYAELTRGDSDAQRAAGIATMDSNMIIISILSLAFIPIICVVLRDVEKLLSVHRYVGR